MAELKGLINENVAIIKFVKRLSCKMFYSYISIPISKNGYYVPIRRKQMMLGIYDEMKSSASFCCSWKTTNFYIVTQPQSHV